MVLGLILLTLILVFPRGILGTLARGGDEPERGATA
jgi:hypothetical protein